MLGTRGIWEDGWKAVALHVPFQGTGHFDKDAWELYHVDVDRAESRNLAKEHPEKLEALIKAWFEEAEKNFVLPLDDRTARRFSTSSGPARSRRASATSTIRARRRCRKASRVNVRGRSYKILATSRSPIRMLGRHLRPRLAVRRPRLFIKDKKLHYVYNFLGIKPEQKFVSPPTQAGQVHARHGVHPREGGPARRVDRHDERCTSTTRSWPMAT
jgi:arylsulfatase